MDDVDRLRKICLGLPEVTERPSHGQPTWFVRDKKMFAQVWAHGHHNDEFPHLVCAAPAGTQSELIAVDPERYFRPPYVGHLGWVGVRLDREPDWDEIAELCREAYRKVAPKRLAALVEPAR